jgi:FKBP-type peptidyl-prolyl cis-trans isomerase SlyD
LSTNSNQNKVANDLVVSMDYELTVDGEMIDATDPGEPLEFIQGYENIIPGLEKAIDGMSVGETKEVLVKAAEAYGEYDPDGFMEVPKAEFPEEIPLEIGLEISVTNDEGEELSAFIEEISLETITLNFNHPLAGKDLQFKVEILGLREATKEELEHGHLHYHDCDCEGDCDCDEEGGCNCHEK